jgi:hypothetical protein
VKNSRPLEETEDGSTPSDPRSEIRNETHRKGSSVINKLLLTVDARKQRQVGIGVQIQKFSEDRCARSPNPDPKMFRMVRLEHVGVWSRTPPRKEKRTNVNCHRKSSELIESQSAKQRSALYRQDGFPRHPNQIDQTFNLVPREGCGKSQ